MNMTTPTNEEVRRQFEAWAYQHWGRIGFDAGRDTKTPEDYRMWHMHIAWQAYQAALSGPAVVALVEALRPFVDATLTPTGQVIGLMHEDFDKARAALAPFTTGAGHVE